MKQIAIITVTETINEYDSHDLIATSITDWDEVSDEEYILICNAAKKSYGGYGKTKFIVLTRCSKEDIATTVKQYVAREAKNEKEREKYRKEQAEKKAKADAKKAEKKKLKEKEEFERLKAKFEKS